MTPTFILNELFMGRVEGALTRGMPKTPAGRTTKAGEGAEHGGMAGAGGALGSDWEGDCGWVETCFVGLSPGVAA